MARCWAIFSIFLPAVFFSGNEDNISAYASSDLVTKRSDFSGNSDILPEKSN